MLLTTALRIDLILQLCPLCVAMAIPVCEEPVVCGGGEECGVEVSREGSLCQRKFLHLLCHLCISLLGATNGMETREYGNGSLK